MQALKSIGIKKAIMFVFYSLVSGLLKIVVLPQIRVLLMRLMGARIGKNTIIQDVTLANLYHYGFSRLEIGDDCFIGDEVMIDTRGGVKLGNHVTLSNRSIVISHINVGYESHPLQKAYPTKEGLVEIRNGAYIGTAAIVLPGVKVGANSVIGAGAVVTKNVAKNTVMVGVPAKVIKKIK
ncbi:acyltransferase [Patescibacteria group bacterium]